MATSDRLNLPVSHAKFIADATRIAVHSREDWPVLSRYGSDMIPDQLDAALKVAVAAEEAFTRKRTVQTPEIHAFKQVEVSVKAIYREYRRSVKYLCPDSANRRFLLREYPAQVPVANLVLGVMTFQKALEELPQTPPFFDRSLFDTTPYLLDEYNRLRALATTQRQERPGHRIDRDAAFAEVRRLVRLTRQIARFAFEEDPVQLERYR